MNGDPGEALAPDRSRLSTVPPWGSPQTPTQGVEVGRPNPSSTVDPGPRGRGAGGFVVLIQQSAGTGDGIRWSLAPSATQLHPDRESAQQAAESTARQFRPEHPMKERRRRVFRVNPDQYVVEVEGMTSVFHFTVTVGEQLV